MQVSDIKLLELLLKPSSKYMDKLPFAFILGASSSDVMNTMFSRVTRSLLSVRKVHLPDGQQRFEYLMRKVRGHVVFCGRLSIVSTRFSST
jgi:hypothetical protein